MGGIACEVRRTDLGRQGTRELVGADQEARGEGHQAAQLARDGAHELVAVERKGRGERSEAAQLRRQGAAGGGAAACDEVGSAVAAEVEREDLGGCAAGAARDAVPDPVRVRAWITDHPAGVRLRRGRPIRDLGGLVERRERVGGGARGRPDKGVRLRGCGMVAVADEVGVVRVAGVTDVVGVVGVAGQGGE